MICILRKKKKESSSNHSHEPRSKFLKKNISENKNDIIKYVDIEKVAKKIEHEPALIRIGKNGISEQIKEEVKKLLPLKKAVKIKILQNSPIVDSKEFFMNLESEIGYKIWRTKGNTAIFIYKKIN